MGHYKSVKLLTRDYQVMAILRERGIKLLRMGKLTISQLTLAEWCGCSLRTLQSSLERLRQAGLIAWKYNYRTIGKKAYRCASSYFLLQGNWRNLMAWYNEVTTRKPRKPLQSHSVHATVCVSKTDLYKKRRWTVEDLRGQGRSEEHIAMILAIQG
jgi:hypothetical protein